MKQLEFFNIIGICEYFFKMIFCYIIPILTVLMIIKKEYKYAKEQTILAQTTEVLGKEDSSSAEKIAGLKFNYP